MPFGNVKLDPAAQKQQLYKRIHRLEEEKKDQSEFIMKLEAQLEARSDYEEIKAELDVLKRENANLKRSNTMLKKNN